MKAPEECPEVFTSMMSACGAILDCGSYSNVNPREKHTKETARAHAETSPFVPVNSLASLSRNPGK